MAAPRTNTTTTADPGGFFGLLDASVDDFLHACKAAQTSPVEAPKDLRNVVVAGMGGSGIGGSLLADIVGHESPVPVVVVKGYRLPAFADKHTLVLAVSYSGDTEETLSVAQAAIARGCKVVGISSGGKLREAVTGKVGLHLPVKAGYQPRAALMHLLGTLVGVAQKLQLTKRPLDATSEKTVRAFHDTLKPNAPKSPARRFAQALYDKVPVLYGSGSFQGVALRGRCQLNENAKIVARNDTLPEANHNDLVALDALRADAPFFVGFLRQSSETPHVAARFNFVAETLDRRGVANDQILVEGETPLCRVLQGILFVDYVSLYAAQMRGVDPADVSIIGALKQHLAGTRLPPTRKT